MKKMILRHCFFVIFSIFFVIQAFCEDSREIERKPDKPAEEFFAVSIPEVAVEAGFSFYKKFITRQDNSNCPYYPSCSQYMKDAVNQNGIFGVIQGLERKHRCTREEHSRGLYPTDSNGKHVDYVSGEEAE